MSPPTPALSFATVQWPLEDRLDMIRVSGEKNFYHNIRQALAAIVEENTFVPARVWLVHVDDLPEDPHAVAVEVPTRQGRARVGYVLPRTARLYRLQMASLGLEGETLEVLASIVRGATSTRASVAVYLPSDFDQFVMTGYHENPANTPAWLSDGVPIRREAVAKQDFTLDEMKKLYCWWAKKHFHPSLPNSVENALCRGQVGNHDPISEATSEYRATLLK